MKKQLMTWPSIISCYFVRNGSCQTKFPLLHLYLAQYLINKQNRDLVLHERSLARWYDISAGCYYRQTRRIAWRPAWGLWWVSLPSGVLLIFQFIPPITAKCAICRQLTAISFETRGFRASAGKKKKIRARLGRAADCAPRCFYSRRSSPLSRTMQLIRN